ncbi:hypothetical protein E5S70_26905 [Ensifer adhaerens]|uniref:TniQ family protein n=1 Tax=Ensifer canadensis TaxID=555315 RepID=UPI00148F524B|nr:TniQ family protein [Ensifer canadensis]NOV19660.1 hypothetical protein [Ensifer canadensis]
MNGMMRVPFFKDELLTSYLSRTARANGSASLRAFCSDVGLDYKDIIRGDGNQVAKAARLLGRSEDELLGRRVASIGLRGVEYAGVVFRRGMMSRTPRRYCPDCMDEDEQDAARMPGTRRYARTSWTLQCVRSCDHHSRLLVPLDRAGWWSDGLAFLSNPRERPSVAELTALPPHSPSTHFERFVMDRLTGMVDHGEFLDGHPLSVCIDLCEQLGLASRLGRSSASRGTKHQARRNSAERGFAALYQGERGILELFDLVADSVGGRAGERNKLAEIISDVSTTLECSPQELRGVVALGFVRSLVGNSEQLAYRTGSYLRTEMMGLRDRLIQCAKPGSEELTSLRKAIDQRKYTPTAAVKLLLEGRLNQAPAPFIGAAQVDLAKSGDHPAPGTTLSGAVVRQRLMICQRSLNQLVASGILRAHAVDRTGIISIRLEEVMRFERRYVTIGKLAAEQCLSPSQIKLKALRAGLTPALPPHLSKTTIFERAAVDSVFGEREGAREQGEEEIGLAIAVPATSGMDRATKSFRKREFRRIPDLGKGPLAVQASGISQ